MSQARRKIGRLYWRLLAAAVVVGFVSPILAPAAGASAGSALGGYTGSAEAASVRVAVYDPAIPFPSSPEVDASIGFAQANTTTGPNSRALASYLWPGDVIGTGLPLLTGNPSAKYPVQVTSAYPAVASAPARSNAQITSGNGMATSADGQTTQATTTGVGLGPNLTSGIGTGLCGVLQQSCPTPPVGFDLPQPLATIASMKGVRTQSTIALTSSTITSTARSTVSGLDLLAGLITINHVDMTSISTSNGATATDQGQANVVGLKVAGKEINLGNPTSIDGTKAAVPQVPVDLAAIGVKIQYLTSTGTEVGTTASRNIAGLTITVDLGVLGKAAGNGALSNALAPVLGQIPNAGPLLIGLAKLGSKMVITVGDVRTSASGTPAYVGPGYNGSGSGSSTPGTSAGGGNLPSSSGGGLPSIAPESSSVIPQGGATTPGQQSGPQPTAFQFPGLAKTPSMLLMACLVLAGLGGWLFRAFGALMLGGEDCAMGLAVGIPNLRKG